MWLDHITEIEWDENKKLFSLKHNRETEPSIYLKEEAALVLFGFLIENHPYLKQIFEFDEAKRSVV